MKKSLSLVFAALLFVALGCSFAGLGTKKEEPPKKDTTSTTSDSTTKTTDTTSKTTDSTTSEKETGSVTLDNFMKIKLGMKYDDVAKVMGSAGNETSSSSVGKYELKTFKWEGEKYKTISASFRNGELRSKYQSNLGTAKADVTKAKYDQMKNGMSYDEVKGIIGSDGIQTNASMGFRGSESTSYRWKGDKFARISARFKDNKMASKNQSNLK